MKDKTMKKYQHVNPDYAKRIIRRAGGAGSNAKTLAGAVKYCVKNHLVPKTYPSAYSANERRDLWKTRQAMDRNPVGSALRNKWTTVNGYRSVRIDDSELAELSLAEGRRICPRKKNIHTGSPRVCGDEFQVRDVPIHYKGRFKGWRGSEFFCDYQSSAHVSVSGRSMVLVQGCKIQRRIIAPSGMRWKAGAYLERISDGMDYHPTLEDMRAKDFVSRVRREMAKNWKARRDERHAQREVKRLSVVFAAQAPSVRVTLEDSRRAGNCVQGSVNFAASRLGMDPQEIVNGAWLVSVPGKRLMDTHDPRAMAAVRVAWQRETMVMI